METARLSTASSECAPGLGAHPAEPIWNIYRSKSLSPCASTKLGVLCAMVVNGSDANNFKEKAASEEAAKKELLNPLARSVDDFVQAFCEVWPLSYFAGESEGSGVEQAPGCVSVSGIG